MLYFNFKYELKILLRSWWIQLISILLLVLFVFAAFNGQNKIEKRLETISEARATVETSDKQMLSLLDSIEHGIPVNVSRWQTPESPIAIGNYHPRVVAMAPSDMGFLAVGQSDIFTHYVMPTVSGDDFAISFTEMTSPIQLLFGSFDLMFVVVYLLPLIIIAFSYNVLSEEKERGTLRLLASQPISIRKWVLQKLALRLFWMTVIIIAVSAIVFSLFSRGSVSDFLAFIGLVFCYMLFWFSLAFAINIRIANSAKNALSLLGLWIVFVLLIPSVISQSGDLFFPIPPRTELISEVRAHKAEATKKQDQILDNFLRDHPEYAVNDSTQARSFWHGYIASQKIIKEELQPLLSSYEEKLEQQQTYVSKFQWMSPAIVTQRALGSMAGTTKRDYNSYQNQVYEFAEAWRNYFVPLLYNNETFKKSMYTELPRFSYTPNTDNQLVPAILSLLLLSCIIIALTLLSYNIKSKRKGMVLMQ
ncbi:DUF3526 domain-containing protein [Formosa sediminum]|uniref:DUF3526 domain-containing protein n=1 Tax=Formosa sediminum TaxID=2594004 RepID=A0A516GSF4_9FLAO|nr:DUF3526 domain-containing protein [Formosa sediminum]QDO94449.1 DUF3526 domain-containing protein [Formosa sediminum]